MKRFGIQLYSVKDEIKEYGLDTVLAEIKAAGYDCVEFAGFYGLTPDEMKATLEKHGLKGVSAHMPASAVAENLPYIDALGIERIYVAWMGADALFGDKHAEAIEEIKAAKALLDERGVMFGYHNHAHEYADGKDGVYTLITEVEGYTAQLDLFWAKVGGHAPAELMKKYGDKLSCLHIKDLDKNWKPGESADAYPCAIIGEGQADCEGSMKLALDMGIDLFILEVEGFPCEYTDYLKKSCDNMKKFAQ